MRLVRGATDSQDGDSTSYTHRVKGFGKMAECPGCGATIRVSNRSKVGDSLDCPECGENLEVISVKPFELDYAFDDEGWEEAEDEAGDEDWEYEEE